MAISIKNPNYDIISHSRIIIYYFIKCFIKLNSHC